MKLWTVSLALLVPLACGDGRTDIISGADADPNAPDADLTIPDADPSTPDSDPFQPDADVNAPDLVGPNIVIVNPTAGSLVGAFVSIQVDITDQSAIAAPVTATWGIGSMPLDTVTLTDQGGGRYAAPYNTIDLRDALDVLFPSNTPQLVNPSLTVRASDTAGNESVVGLQVVMDYTPPLLSLDPPDVRESKIVMGVLQCSLEFDPVGDDAVNDLEASYQLSEIRARVEDFGNTGDSASNVVTFKAGIDPTTVQLFILSGPSANADALVVDTSGDGLCNEINPTLGNELLVIDLAGVAAAGISYFIDDPGGYTGYTDCTAPVDTPDPPDPVCQFTSSLTRIIADPFSSDPVIYGIPPFSELVCLGPPLDGIAAGIADGWACLAVRATDYLGNVGVSPPIRVCFDWSGPNVVGANCPLEAGNIYSDPGFDCLGTYIGGVSVPTATCQTSDFGPDKNLVGLP